MRLRETGRGWALRLGGWFHLLRCILYFGLFLVEVILERTLLYIDVLLFLGGEGGMSEEISYETL